MTNSNKGNAVAGSFIGMFVFICLLGLIAFGMYGCPQYSVYSARKDGEAILAHAQSSREVAVAEAKAKMEAATLLAQAEVERAKGVAAANKIIGDSLKENEAYLRYLWVTEVAAANQPGKTVVYIPTEGNVPVMEANRLVEKK